MKKSKPRYFTGGKEEELYNEKVALLCYETKCYDCQQVRKEEKKNGKKSDRNHARISELV